MGKQSKRNKNKNRKRNTGAPRWPSPAPKAAEAKPPPLQDALLLNVETRRPSPATKAAEAKPPLLRQNALLLNMETLRAVQHNNGETLHQIRNDMNEGLSLGLKLDPAGSKQMLWLGVGHLSSFVDGTHEMAAMLPFCSTAIDLFNNGAALFPAFAELPRPPKLQSRCCIGSASALSANDQEWLEGICDGSNLVFYLDNHDPLTPEGACIDITVTSINSDWILRYTGYPKKRRQGGAIQTNNRFVQLVGGDDSKELKLFVTRILHSFLRHYAYLLPRHILLDLMDNHVEGLFMVPSKKYKEDYLDWQILRTDLLLNFPNMSVHSRFNKDGDEYNNEEFAKELESRLAHVGCALSSLDMFELAAPLYVEIGGNFPNSIQSYCCAASSFFTMGDFDASLDMTAKCLALVLERDPHKEDPHLGQGDYKGNSLKCFYRSRANFLRLGMQTSAVSRSRMARK